MINKALSHLANKKKRLYLGLLVNYDSIFCNSINEFFYVQQMTFLYSYGDKFAWSYVWDQDLTQYLGIAQGASTPFFSHKGFYNFTF